MKQEKIDAMAKIMVEARRDNEDVGDLVSAALHDAANKLGDAAQLVVGRPGSWEAAIVLDMAASGGWAPNTNTKRVEALSALFVEMGQANENGGDVVSLAMSFAVEALGGLTQFAGESAWRHNLTNMGRQYSQYWDQEA
jgi:hypothetical protein